MNILSSYTGNEQGTPAIIPAGPAYNFTKAEIELLLQRQTNQGEDPAGVRLHFSADSATATQPQQLIAIGVSTDNITEEIFTAGDDSIKDYIISDNDGRRSRSEVLPRLVSASTAKSAQGANFNPNRDACVYFSRRDLNQILAQGDNNLSHFRFHLCDFVTGISPNGNPVVFKSLIVSGRDASGNQLGTAIRSALPCPPHCGTDYPAGTGGQ